MSIKFFVYASERTNRNSLDDSFIFRHLGVTDTRDEAKDLIRKDIARRISENCIHWDIVGYKHQQLTEIRTDYQTRFACVSGDCSFRVKFDIRPVDVDLFDSEVNDDWYENVQDAAKEIAMAIQIGV
jgi:hypothetical protein